MLGIASLTRPSPRLLIASLAVAALMALLSGCGNGSPGTDTATIHVVAAENFWGSLAAQLGGNKVSVSAIISNPNTDPHDYEATPGDARAMADARYVVFNGFGYDPWVQRLLDANGSSGQTTLSVQKLLGLQDDDNPHRWFSPDDVARVVDQITADYKAIDPPDSAYFDQQKSDLQTSGFKQYNELVATIRQSYAGTPIGATESIVSPLADSLGLKVLTPTAFLNAISEGGDPTAQDKATFDQQIASKQISVLVFNTQNATPDVQRLVDAANANGIPVVAVTETLVPADARFQDWQSKQLQALADALAKATGK